MSEKKMCEIFLCINEDGDFEVATDEGEATERLTENWGGSQMRMVKLSVTILPPKLTEITGDVPDEAGAIREMKVS